MKKNRKIEWEKKRVAKEDDAHLDANNGDFECLKR